MSNNPQIILEILRKTLGTDSAPLHEPIFTGNENQYLLDCVASTFVSSIGQYVVKFEKQLSEFTGAKHVVAVVNGTAALQIALKLVGVEKDQEVLVPALSFVATANAVSYLNAVPHFIDSCLSTMGLDPISLRDWLKFVSEQTAEGCRNKQTGRKIAAIVPMHTFGHPCEMNELVAIANEYNLNLVEDAAEGLGSYYDGKHVGHFGKAGTLSFNGNKVITTGGGGAILTNDRSLADRAKHLTTTAKKAHPWRLEHDEIGYNFRLPNLNAALGVAQMESIETFLASKRKLTALYEAAFQNVQGVDLFVEKEKCTSNYWLQTIILDQSISGERELIIEQTNQAGFLTRPAWKLLHEMQPFSNCPRSPLPNAKKLAKSIINLPSSASLVKC